jgi:diadenosine tetraphosphate (Ap4A) HIT family hydrolase
MCPTDWRFKYAHGIAKQRGKADPDIELLKRLTDPYELPERLKNEHFPDDSFIYIDETLAITYDAEADMPLHLLILPVDHIENFDILNYPEVLNDMLLAGQHLVKKSSTLKEAYLSISAKKEKYQGSYFRHFHIHLQSRDTLDKEELLSLLTPRFYRPPMEPEAGV